MCHLQRPRLGCCPPKGLVLVSLVTNRVLLEEVCLSSFEVFKLYNNNNNIIVGLCVNLDAASLMTLTIVFTSSFLLFSMSNVCIKILLQPVKELHQVLDHSEADG